MRTPNNRLNMYRFSTLIDPAILSGHPMLNSTRIFRYDLSTAEQLLEETFDFDFGMDLWEGDMDVTAAGSVGGASPIRPTQMNPADGINPSAAPGLEVPQDEVQISSAARMIDQLPPDSQIRQVRLAEIRSAIEAGVYDSPEKMEAAVDRLLRSNDLLGD